jgi:hypothetical protein
VLINLLSESICFRFGTGAGGSISGLIGESISFDTRRDVGDGDSEVLRIEDICIGDNGINSRLGREGGRIGGKSGVFLPIVRLILTCLRRIGVGIGDCFAFLDGFAFLEVCLGRLGLAGAGATALRFLGGIEYTIYTRQL